MIFNIEVDKNKKVLQDEIVVNQYENEIDELHFKLPFDDFEYLGVFKSPKDEKLELPVNDNVIVIDKNITSIAGNWSLIVTGKKDETIFVSNTIELRSCKNYLNYPTMQKVDANIEFLYSEIQETLHKLNETGIEEISSLLEELKTINQKLDNTQLSDAVSEVADKADAAILKLDGIIADLTNLSENMAKLEGMESDLRDLKDMVDKIPTVEYKEVLNDIIELLTDADSIADAIL